MKASFQSWEVIRLGGRSPHEWDYYPYKRDPESSFTPSTCEDTVRRQPSVNEEADSYQMPNLPAT